MQLNQKECIFLLEMLNKVPVVGIDLQRQSLAIATKLTIEIEKSPQIPTLDKKGV